MRGPDPLADYVREALAAGHGRDAIAAALAAAGWAPAETRAALSAWIDVAPLPPAPRPRALVSPRDALVHATLYLALGLFAVNLGLLAFALIDLHVPDPLEALPPERGGAIRWAIAVMLIAWPLWAWLTLRFARFGAAGEARRSAVARWLTAAALFVATAILIGDIVALVAALLGGDAGLRFLLKVATVAVIAGAVFLAYLPETADETAP